MSTSIQTIQTLLRSDRMNVINPVNNFFDEAERAYGGKKYIQKYISALPLINVEAGILFITDWLIKFYLQARFNITNRSFLILQGGENTGKSTALEWLNPLDGYLKTGPLATDSKDTRIAITFNTMWNDDELSLRKSEINKVKALVALNVINERQVYARSEETRKRICSFCGSTNSMEILQSTEDNTRFSILGLKDGENVRWADYEKIDKSQFWGEVINLYKEGWTEKNKEALDEMRKSVNKENIINTVIRDAIMDTLETTANVEQKNRTVCNITDIIKYIDPLGEFHAVQQQAHVREVITKEFGNGRWNGYRQSQGKRVLTRGYPVQLKGKGGEREEKEPESETVTAGQKTKTNAKTKTRKKRGRKKNST